MKKSDIKKHHLDRKIEETLSKFEISVKSGTNVFLHKDFVAVGSLLFANNLAKDVILDVLQHNNTVLPFVEFAEIVVPGDLNKSLFNKYLGKADTEMPGGNLFSGVMLIRFENMPSGKALLSDYSLLLKEFQDRYGDRVTFVFNVEESCVNSLLSICEGVFSIDLLKEVQLPLKEAVDIVCSDIADYWEVSDKLKCYITSALSDRQLTKKDDLKRFASELAYQLVCSQDILDDYDAMMKPKSAEPEGIAIGFH